MEIVFDRHILSIRPNWDRTLYVCILMSRINPFRELEFAVFPSSNSNVLAMNISLVMRSVAESEHFDLSA
jgi:hypothetical protein